MSSRFMLAIVFAVLVFQPAVSFSGPIPPISNPSPSPAPSLPVLPNNLHCLDSQHQSMSLNNTQVETWEKSTKDQFSSRGFVQGPITKIYANQTGHAHFAIDLGNNQGIEVIYQIAFGALPNLQVGTNVIACGDYITVGPHAQLPSPMPAIIHWLHWNPGNRDGGVHPGGFLVINNVAYGLTGTGSN